MTKLAGEKQIVVIGDIHSRLDLAFDGLNQLEHEHGDIDQVFSVGDAGLFLCADDWSYLAGPKKYRRPERSPQITAAWEKWRWPMAMIGGNHEPHHRLRMFDTVHFGPKLSYTDAGILKHQVPDLRVYGLSGIFHPAHLGFGTVGHGRQPTPRGWADLATLAINKAIAPRQLSYYKQQDLDLLLRLAPEPDLLLIHDWPVPPPHIHCSGVRPEMLLVERLRPKWVCCGHHHVSAEFSVGKSKCIALNIVTNKDSPSVPAILPGWAGIFRWTGTVLEKIALWPTAERWLPLP